jgi:NADH dehydrogenase
MTTSTHAVTGAFGYSGKYIARRLLDAGRDVITLTNSTQRPNPFGDRVRAVPFHFEQPENWPTPCVLEVLYNTYCASITVDSPTQMPYRIR